MSKNIECEERVMISLKEYQALMKDYAYHPHAELLEIINYYFDDPKLSLRNAHYMLRVRNTNYEDYEFTLKIKGKDGDTEINEPLNSDEAEQIYAWNDFPVGEVMDKVKEVADEMEIITITRLKTSRIEVQFNDHLLVIDRNIYSDVVDYDIEVEASNMEDAKKYIKHYCDKYHLTFSDNYKSKSRRAINKALNID